LATYLITWNPNNWQWEDLPATAEKVWRGERVRDTWTAASRKIRPGDRLFLLRQGVEPRGITATATALSEVRIGPHFDPERAAKGDTRPFVEIEWDVVLIPEESRVLPRSRLDANDMAGVYWNTQMSGIAIADDVASALEEAWQKHLLEICYR